jgi:hypothetical protein
VTDVQLKYTKDGHFRRFAFIGYKVEEEATAAQSYFDQTYIDTCRISVGQCANLGTILHNFCIIARSYCSHSYHIVLSLISFILAYIYVLADICDIAFQVIPQNQDHGVNMQMTAPQRKMTI